MLLDVSGHIYRLFLLVAELQPQVQSLNKLSILQDVQIFDEAVEMQVSLVMLEQAEHNSIQVEQLFIVEIVCTLEGLLLDG